MTSLGSFPGDVRVRTKHVGKTRVGLWGQSSSRISSRYNWYQSRDPAGSVADEDVGPLKGGVIVTVTFP